jgi:dipeptidyl aminopeptidase/acylaminoacyl peptidase
MRILNFIRTRPLFLALAYLLAFSKGTIGQKILIDSNVYNAWPEIRDMQVSADGKYVSYIIDDRSDQKSTTFIQSMEGNWKREFAGTGGMNFSDDGRKAIVFQNKKVVILALPEGSIHYLDSVVYCRFLKENDTIDLLVYKKDGTNELKIRNLSTGEESVFASVDKYWVGPNGKMLVTLTTPNAKGVCSMESIGNAENMRKTIWTGFQLGSVLFGGDGSRMAFVGDENGKPGKTIWCYNIGDSAAARVVDGHSQGIDSDFVIDKITGLGPLNEWLTFRLKRIIHPTPAVGNFGVNVWSYKDAKLQPQQLIDVKASQGVEFCEDVVNVSDRNIFRLATGDQSLRTPFYSDAENRFVLLLDNGPGELHDEWNWNRDARSSIYLVSLMDGSRKLIRKNVPGPMSHVFYLSPDGKYVLYYDAVRGNYFSYDSQTGVTRNLTSTLGGRWIVPDREDEPQGIYSPLGIAGFVKNSNSVLLYDRFDIYEVDLSGKDGSHNLTGGYGRRHHIEFRLAISSFHEPIDLHRGLMLSAFDTASKENGFFVTNGIDREPRLLVMQPAKFGEVIKAKNANVFVLKRMTESEFPNMYGTVDFKMFVPITAVHPEEKYNWMTTELLTWKSFDGRMVQGILYKPQNFSPHIKYPVIFYYYEQLSDNLHNFILPHPNNGVLNIPLYVSNGYLVFVPDIHYKVGYPGRSAYMSVVSAANYLSRMPFVDASKMGIEGHSFGGFETNYIITHCNLFAAAASSSGMSDFISAYGSIVGEGTSRQGQYELYRDRIGATLWQRPDLYLENSPVLRADKVKTPLLMMANSDDDDVPWQQGVEFFTALRRLEKRVWLLQYDSEGHLLSRPRSTRDLSIRMFQFFNFYLKGSPAPIWMTRGIPARLKDVDKGIELDTTGTIP